jgi:hypothetical protein
MADPGPATARRGGGGIVTTLAVGGVFVVVVVSVVLAVVLLSGSDATTRTYVISAGTGARAEAGEEIDIMPTEVELAVGDTIVIRNEDDREYTVGPYLVRAGEEVRQTFQRPQVLVGECSLSGSGEIRIVVT